MRQPFSRKTLLVCAVALLIAAACGTDRGETPGSSPVGGEPTAQLASQVEPTSEHDPLSSGGYGIGPDPTNVQGVVNRAHAIVIAEITSWDGARNEGPYVNGVLTTPSTPLPGRPHVEMSSGYFSFEIERVLLDDGYVRDATSFRGAAEQDHRFNPDVGERYILTLFRNPDNRSYGTPPTFGMIELTDGRATRQDGSPLRIEAPASEEALVREFEDAVEVRRPLTVEEWREPYADQPIALQ